MLVLRFMGVLDKILEKKFLEIEERKNILPLDGIVSKLKNSSEVKRNFYYSLKKSVSNGKPGLIAEIKFASPSRGVIRDSFTLEYVAKVYQESSYVDCISVLTEKYFFNGDISFIGKVKGIASKPILRKDFIIDEYQVYESAYYGADCILLIASCLSREQIKRFLKLSKDLGMSVLVEIYSKEDIQKIDGLDIEILGINSRNLNTLEISLERSFSILKSISSRPYIIVAESGIKTKDDVLKAISWGFNSFLIGESFMSSDDVDLKIREIMEGVVL